MSIIKTVKTVDDRYARIENAALRDTRLSWKARGLLAYLLSMPDNWHTNIRHLTGQSPGGESVVRTGLKELEEAGYLTRNPVKGDDGRITHWESVVYESPPKPNAEPQCDFPHVEKPDVENRTLRTTKAKNNPSTSSRKQSSTAVDNVGKKRKNSPARDHNDRTPIREMWFNPHRVYADIYAWAAFETRVATMGQPRFPSRWRRAVGDQWTRDNLAVLDAFADQDPPLDPQDVVDLIERGTPDEPKPVVVGCEACRFSGWHDDGDKLERCTVTGKELRTNV